MFASFARDFLSAVSVETEYVTASLRYIIKSQPQYRLKLVYRITWKICFRMFPM